MVLELSRAPYITIAVIRGRTRGGGNELPLDLRYASREKAIFGQPEVVSGLLPGGGGSERLPRAIGRDRSLEAILNSDDYNADTAERWGWVTRALPDSELDALVGTVAARLASFDRTSPASAKARINRASLPRTRTWSPRTASSPTPSPSPVSSPAPQPRWCPTDRAAAGSTADVIHGSMAATAHPFSTPVGQPFERHGSCGPDGRRSHRDRRTSSGVRAAQVRVERLDGAAQSRLHPLRPCPMW
ncbi:enoyl-CoA hydratase/isomerase family protein [Streptomyces asoensis]|uniref:enoyl-CoA hydratase/isomerase family protein n=1 Tax=Streptomyces asoensis TaxID=249586 RepID=UPI0033C485D7